MVLQITSRFSNRVVRNLLFCTIPKRSNTKSPLLLSSASKESSLTQSRCFQTTVLQMDKGDHTVSAKVLTITNPLKYITMKIKALLMRGYFDQDFNESDFLSGARQAIIYVSNQLSKGEIQGLKEVLTQSGMQCAQKLLTENHKDKDVLKVEESNIMTLALNDLGFEYGEAGRKWAYALVICYCSGKDSFSKQSTDFDFEILTSQPRIIKYSFCREYTPGCTEGWMVDDIDHTNLHIYRD